MRQSISLFKKEVDTPDKILSFFIFFIPLFLALSIFMADLFASLSGIILIYIILKKKALGFIKLVKIEIIYFSILYLIILLSLIFGNYKEKSFLPSFFYFRYFLLSLSIFYLLIKYKFIINIFYLSIFGSIGFVVFDALVQYFLGYNLFGYQLIGYGSINELQYLTSFFDKEKKLGSYLVRFLPLIICLIYLSKTNFLRKNELSIVLLIGSIVYLCSERTALFLLFFIYFFYFLNSDKKKYFVASIILVFSALLLSNERLKDKYINYTLQQTQILQFFKKQNENNYDQNKIARYYSKEHENLAFTGLIIFKENFLVGSGVKSFHHECLRLKKENKNIKTSRDNNLVCSTHPHSTYIQILSEIGIFGFFVISFLFLKVFFINLKLLLKKKKSDLDKSFFYANLIIIVNLMPFIPSGSIFNNWLNLILFFPIGFWMYIKNQIKNDS